MQKKGGHFSGIRSAKIDNFTAEEKQFSGPVPRPRKLLDHVRDVLRVTYESRFGQHVHGDCFATSYRGPWKLIYYEAYLEQADALGRPRGI